MDIIISTKKTTRLFYLTVATLLSIHIVFEILDVYFGHDYVFGLVKFLKVTNEGVIPTMYSTIALLFSSLLLAIIAYTQKKSKSQYFTHWGFLSFIFLFLAMDEALEVHERTSIIFRTLLDTSGVFEHAWVIPYGVGVILLCLGYRKFIISLPPKTKKLFILAGFVYVLGAIGMEIVHPGNFFKDGSYKALGRLCSTLEELFEMGGIVIFIHALLSYIDTHLSDLRISFSK